MQGGAQQQQDASTSAWGAAQQQQDASTSAWGTYLEGVHAAEPHTAHGTYLSNRHSRSLTVHEALARLGVLPSHCHASNVCGERAPRPASPAASAHHDPNRVAAAQPWERGQELRITIAGADRNEGCSAEGGRVHRGAAAPCNLCRRACRALTGPPWVPVLAAESAARFGELLRLCSMAGVERVRLLLCGPGAAPLRNGGGGAPGAMAAVAGHA